MKILKKLTALAITIAFISVTTGISAQNIQESNVPLTDEHGQKISFEEIVDSRDQTMVIFWESNDMKHIDFLDQMNDIFEEMSETSNISLVAVCSDKYHSNQQVQKIANSRGWDIDVYVDINNSFKRTNGLADDGLISMIYADNSRLLATENNPVYPGQVFAELKDSDGSLYTLIP